MTSTQAAPSCPCCGKPQPAMPADYRYRVCAPTTVDISCGCHWNESKRAAPVAADGWPTDGQVEAACIALKGSEHNAPEYWTDTKEQDWKVRWRRHVRTALLAAAPSAPSIPWRDIWDAGYERGEYDAKTKSAPPPTDEQMRREFEARFSSRFLDRSIVNPDEYSTTEVQRLWEGWQAAKSGGRGG